MGLEQQQHWLQHEQQEQELGVSGTQATGEDTTFSPMPTPTHWRDIYAPQCTAMKEKQKETATRATGNIVAPKSAPAARTTTPSSLPTTHAASTAGDDAGSNEPMTHSERMACHLLEITEERDRLRCKLGAASTAQAELHRKEMEIIEGNSQLITEHQLAWAQESANTDDQSTVCQ